MACPEDILCAAALGWVNEHWVLAQMCTHMWQNCKSGQCSQINSNINTWADRTCHCHHVILQPLQTAWWKDILCAAAMGCVFEGTLRVSLGVWVGRGPKRMHPSSDFCNDQIGAEWFIVLCMSYPEDILWAAKMRCLFEGTWRVSLGVWTGRCPKTISLS